MSDPDALAAAIAAHGPVMRVVVVEFQGSSPREVGAEMLVWADGQSGTIGGGALEFDAIARAREMLKRGATEPRFDRIPLGPALGQCCGGSVVLMTQRHDAQSVAALAGQISAAAGPGQMPLAVRRELAKARGQGIAPKARMIDGWFVEPLTREVRPLWIWGAGHVGRAVVSVLSPLPDVAITWVDTTRNRFPAEIPAGVTPIWTLAPGALVAHAPADAEHLILTYSHALDLELCHRLLHRGFAFCGLIGSATKWARFRSRLAALGHADTAIDRITCPIGMPELGKHPQQIAVGVAAQLIAKHNKSETEITDDRDGNHHAEGRQRPP